MTIGSGVNKLRRVLLAIAVSMMAAALFAPAAGALLPGELKAVPSRAELRANCPVFDTLVEVVQCAHADVIGGSVTLNKEVVPITVPGDTLDVGEAVNYANPNALFEGVMGSKVPLAGPGQPVPGGLFGLTGLPSKTAVTATLEYAGPLTPNEIVEYEEEPFFDMDRLNSAPLNPAEKPGVNIPTKIHLQNQFLGKNCYIGSDTEPMGIHLTTGATSPPPPNKPIRGDLGVVQFEWYGEVIRTTGTVIVDNSLSAPAARGCGEMYDKAINYKIGLPSPAGHNTMIFKSTAWVSGAFFDEQ